MARGDWKTREVREAEAALAAAVERGREAARKAQQVSASMRNTRLSDDDIRQIDRAARGRDAAPELRALAERVDRGDLTWRDVVDGHAMHDPGVQAAMRTGVARLGGVYRQFEEGLTLDEVLEAETGRASRVKGAGDDDDPPPVASDDDEQRSVLRDDGW